MAGRTCTTARSWRWCACRSSCSATCSPRASCGSRCSSPSSCCVAGRPASPAPPSARSVRSGPVPTNRAGGTGRRAMGRGPVHGGRGVLAGDLRRRVDQRLQRDGALGVHAGHRVGHARTGVGRLAVHLDPPADRCDRRRARGDTDTRPDRARHGVRHRRVWTGARLAEPDRSPTGRHPYGDPGDRRGTAATGRPRGGELRQVRHALLGARRPPGALVAGPVASRLVRREQRQLLLAAVPDHHRRAVPATGRDPLRAARTRHPVRPGRARTGRRIRCSATPPRRR